MHCWKRLTLLMSAFLGLWATPSAVLAQDATQSETSAFILTPLSFLKELDLEFGTVIPGNTGGTLVMDSAGNVSTSGSVIHIAGTQQPARFAGFGAFRQTVSINVDSDAYILTRVGGTQTMLMDTLLIGSQPPIIINTNPRSFLIGNPAGFFFFTIAGRLQVPANAVPGTYEGEFTVTLEYE